tara:strand:- start:4160 stop:4306 length:147 start_codon:yes stop_codon:yes gene_type:complete
MNLNDNIEFSINEKVELIILDIIMKISIKYNINYYELIDFLKNKKNII